MLINSLLLAVSSSIDSLGIGITYGIKNTKISYKSKIILFVISFLICILSIWFGDFIRNIFSDSFSKIIGALIISFIGLFVIFQCLYGNSENNLDNEKDLNFKEFQKQEKIYSFFIKFLGITIKIIKNPKYSDLNNSNLIEPNEAFFLSFALSLDCFCIGVGSSVAGISSSVFPFFISIFQLFFLSLGNFLGRKLYKFSKLPSNIWSILSRNIACINWSF